MADTMLEACSGEFEDGGRGELKGSTLGMVSMTWSLMG